MFKSIRAYIFTLHIHSKSFIATWIFFLKKLLLIYTYIDKGQSCRRGTKSDCKNSWLWVRSRVGNREMKYLIKFIFSFLNSGIEAKCGVEFHHSRTSRTSGSPGTSSTRRKFWNFQNSAEDGERKVFTLNSLYLPCCVRDTA